MKTKPLGRTGITVSHFCLGTMTWGSQNSEAEAHGQMDRAAERGVNFFDTAEMYPTTPRSAETLGKTEELIGTWWAKSGKRDQIVLASKILGEGTSMARNGAPISGKTMREALDASLKRLQTEYVDLYQLHWPNRGSYHFRKHWTYEPSDQKTQRELDHFVEVLSTADELIREGKIRALGVSNDTAWGIMRMVRLAEERGLPRIASVQNEYNLLNRLFDTDLSEVAHHEDVGLLAYSPLAAGLLTGKYDGGAVPEGSRWAINGGLGGREAPQGMKMAEAYNLLARRHGLDPAQMALAFAASRPFMTSVIIGATSLEQLDNALDAADLTLSDEVMEEINTIRRSNNGLPI
ncbi:aldo/keto reductase [Notoacmeibacter sp. MSK16QG-6]|uniref:aldo/keto reductase n=1 Tax=Notoacmeibacter sp. MSK16QG-6 TaxID=2957982 RepID=UPI00209CCAD5|nr:aldo/keto reductase [Notoacmeibacter sp. MSK16QG-6]MCP1197972.1 aldo/keto reductase [Notoacmeibacter sp. MSK16QG-6]